MELRRGDPEKRSCIKKRDNKLAYLNFLMSNSDFQLHAENDHIAELAEILAKLRPEFAILSDCIEVVVVKLKNC